jgi:Cu-Zn family superoxide dismutase
MSRLALGALTGALCVLATAAAGQQKVEHRTKVTMHLIDDKGPGAAIGTVSFSDSPQGLVIEPDLAKLPPGQHGFHVHENPSCGAMEKDGKMTPGLAAGEHYDPHNANAHRGPKEKESHLGDLPVLTVAKDGTSKGKLLAPRLKVTDLRGRALLIHEGGDNYADKPKPSGGGGGRIACGLFEIKMAD